MKSILQELRDSTTRAFFFEIDDITGKCYRGTSFARTLQIAGNRYSAVPGFEGSNISSATAFKVSDSEIKSFFNALGISQRDVRLGKLDNAEVRTGLVDYKDPTKFAYLHKGNIAEFSDSPSKFFMFAVLGMVAKLGVQMGKFLTIECPLILGSVACGVQIRPPVIARNTFYRVGECVRVAVARTRAVEELVLTNGDFDTAGIAPGIAVGGAPARVTSDGALGPFAGAGFLGGSGSSPDGLRYLRSEDLTAVSMFDDTNIANGQVTLEIEIQRANGGGDIRDPGRIQVYAQDIDGNTLKRLWNGDFIRGGRAAGGEFFGTGWEVISPTNAWQLRTHAGAVLPVGTSRIAVYLEGLTRSGTKCNAAFDELVLRYVQHDAAFDQSAFGNVYFECIAEGTTGGTQPTFDDTVGNDTTDGAVFRCRNSWTKHATISAVLSDTLLEVDVDEPRAAENNWWQQGSALFESGDNAEALPQLIMSSSGSLQTITLYSKFPFPPQVGDKIVLVPGCLKRHMEDCVGKFNNGPRFGGYPFTASTDKARFFARPVVS